MRLNIDLKLQQERPNTDEEGKLQREIVKLNEEIQEEKQKQLRLEVELDNVKANNESEMEELKKQLEKLHSQLKNAEDKEALHLLRIKELVFLLYQSLSTKIKLRIFPLR